VLLGISSADPEQQSANLKTELVLDALDMAIALRKPGTVIHRADKGSPDIRL
jgi:hypothetical protein